MVDSESPSGGSPMDALLLKLKEQYAGIAVLRLKHCDWSKMNRERTVPLHSTVFSHAHQVECQVTSRHC